MAANNGVYIPESMQKNVFIHFHIDYVDFEEDTEDGKGTTHVFMMAGFQRRTLDLPTESFDIKGHLKSSLKLIENDFNKILDCPKPCGKQFKKSTTDDNYLTVHPWNAYTSIIIDSEAERDFTTNVFMFPLIPAPASDISSVYTALKRSQMISTWLGGDDFKTVISLDLDLYTRAYNHVHCRTDLRDKFIICLGELHTIFAHLRAIRSFIEHLGIDDGWLEADVYGPNTIRQIEEICVCA
ncbi:hypothetical protein LOTGIDRAFT_158524 [Lottia gigantea]|uniref:Uncharacterized protein n=1 Tax=Lottia gigantea TaxID=225164 RepID=V4CC41_LOTGI|nr:hypothetical protein LOTGIDRAFT_158524 [Lottia gigantea]ESO99439.1 hypothetical protein LOTGIDRAFT_158524 [Lottia gigantea]